jgi:hypothetical protein
MPGDPCIFVPPDSPILAFARAIAWLWRLGPIVREPDPRLIGMGGSEEAADLHAQVRRGELAGAVIFTDRPGSDVGPLPGRARRRGVADFGDGDLVLGQFSCLTEGEAALRSSIGVHTTREERWMVVGADPTAAWGALDQFWVLPALAEFLVEVLDRPLVMLPAVGWVRYDDAPGNGQEVVKERTKPDAEWKERLEELRKLFGDAGAKLNIAISARTLRDEREVAIDELWPEAVRTIADGVRADVFEPLCHGYIHLDTAALKEDRIEPREFARMPFEEAERKLDTALTWMTETFAVGPSSFIAPNWAYGEGILKALDERGLRAWLPPRPGPLFEGINGRETMISTLEGLYRLHFGPFKRLAEVGYPPTIIIHGGLFDARFANLSLPRDALTYARLYRKRDLFRVPWTDGVRWIGAGELLDHLGRHDQIAVTDGSITAPSGTSALVRDRIGTRSLVL